MSTTASPALGVTFQGVLGSVISSLRTSEGRTIKQSDIAEQLGLNVSTWSRIERGELPISLDQLLMVAAFLEIPLSTLFKCVEEKAVELQAKGIGVFPSKRRISEEDVVQLSVAQVAKMTAALSPVLSIGVGAAVAAYGLYRSLKKESE
jgi:transcriptional regulator with XRE-family HTH domain